MAGLADGIIRDDVDEEIFGAVVDELMRLVRREDERVAALYIGPAILCRI
jgi:hypothetical protein